MRVSTNTVLDSLISPAGIYLLKVNNRNTRNTVSIVNFEHVIAGWEDALQQVFCIFKEELRRRLLVAFSSFIFTFSDKSFFGGCIFFMVLAFVI